MADGQPSEASPTDLEIYVRSTHLDQQINPASSTHDSGTSQLNDLPNWIIELDNVQSDSTRTSNGSRTSQQQDSENEDLRSDDANVPLLENPDLLRYASNSLLSRFIPGFDPNEDRAQTFRVKRSKRSNMLKIQMALALVVSACNIAFAIWALRAHRPLRGVGTLFHGECSSATQMNKGAHAALNLMSSLFLGAGNYCMQVLVAPSAKHAQSRMQKSFDVGIQSFHNWRHLRLSRKLLWLGLGIFSTLLHLTWNSALFASIPFVQFPVAVVTKDFNITNDEWVSRSPPWQLGPTPDIREEIAGLRNRVRSFGQLEARDCIAKYIDPLKATAELVLVTNETATRNKGSSLISSWVSGNSPPRWEASTGWICAAHNGRIWTRFCSLDWALSFENNWTFDVDHDQGVFDLVVVDHCLVGKSAETNTRCGLHYNADILILVCIFCALDTAIICCIATMHADDTLVLLGDAIAESLKSHRGPLGAVEEELRPLRWPAESRRPRWFAAASMKTWIYSLCLMTGGVASGLALLIYCILSLQQREVSTSPSSLWSQGLGQTNAYSLVGGLLAADGAAGRATRFGHVLVANSPQALVSFFYLFYNNILTCQVVADEFIRYLQEKKALRVSSPVNIMQRSSYFLSLPWRYAVPQMASFVLLHWLVSQSIFLVQTTAYSAGPEGKRVPSTDASRLGFSALGILLTVLLGALLILALLLNSFRRYPVAVPTHFPQMATKLSALRASCHRAVQDNDAYLYPVKLGVVSHAISVPDGCSGRLAFSSDEAMLTPEDGSLYELALLHEDKSWRVFRRER